MIEKVIKYDGSTEPFDINKVYLGVAKAFVSCGSTCPQPVRNQLSRLFESESMPDTLPIKDIQNYVEDVLMESRYKKVAKAYIKYRYDHKTAREYADKTLKFIENYKNSSTTADVTIDDNSNVGGRNVGIINAEAPKKQNVLVQRRIIMNKISELYPDFNAKQYVTDLNKHIIYKHDENSFTLPVPYCAAISMYPFIKDGIKNLDGLSVGPKKLESFCGIYVNMLYALGSQFAGAIATPEFLVYFDYYARQKWGDDYYKRASEVTTSAAVHKESTIESDIRDCFEQVIYSFNQPAASRGLQSVFVNFSYFDKYFFDGMFGNFYFPDGTKPTWDSVCWLQKFFMKWFNKERERCILTFPVESFALIYKDGKFLDQDSYKFVCEELSRGHSFFVYISDTVDSLSSCCRLKNEVNIKDFSFTNGNMGIQTGSKSVITLNLNRITQDYCKSIQWKNKKLTEDFYTGYLNYIDNILNRVYIYHEAYNECLWDNYNSNLLPAYKAGFIDLNKQYLTIGINGLNEAAEFLHLNLTDNKQYAEFCQRLFDNIKKNNMLHRTKKMRFNTEMVPAESLAAKNYNWDKEDGYWLPEDRNLYASYIYLPSDTTIDIFEKLRMHGSNFIGQYLDGGSAAHINLDSHPSATQYESILTYAAKHGCQYLGINVPNTECKDCGKIFKQPYESCPQCNSTNLKYYDRVIGYLTEISKWSAARRIEQKTRYYEHLREK